MELTLTGASLTSDGKGSSNSNDSAGLKSTSTTTSSTTSSNNAAKNQQKAHSHSHDHGNSHGHDHGHGHAGKACCNNQNKAPSNFQSVEKIPKEKLISNPAILFSAIITSVKGGTFDTFKYLVDMVIEEEKDKQAPMNWGIDIICEDADDAYVNVNANTAESIFASNSDGKNSGKFSSKKCTSALGRKGQDGHTLVHWTAKRADDLRFIEYLSQQVININVNARSTDNVGMTPLHWAATEGSIPVVNFILKHLEVHSTGLSFSTHSTNDVKPSSHPINSRDKSGCTPLLIASQYGHADLAAFLIKHWADPNAVDDSRDTALHWAAYKGAVPVCGLLLHLNGIEDHLDTIDAFGQSPLHLASLRGNTDVITYIIEQAEAFVDAKKNDSKSNNVSKSGALTLFPAKLLNMADREGKTPLDLAIKKKKGQAEILLRQYMSKYCISDQTMWQKIVAVVKPFFSCKSWLSWIGLTSENGRPPRFIFWFVAVNLALAFLYELVVYVPLYGSEEDGRLWDYTRLHYCTILSFIATIVNFVLVNRTDPGLLAKKNYACSNSNGAISMDYCMDATSMLCMDENKRIRREMHTFTNDLRNMYEETLESFAVENANEVERLPLCHSCHISRPHRSKHCRVLNRCVLMFDHHCPFVGTTIGLYNYKYFYLFVCSFTIAEILFGITGILYLKQAPENMEFEVTKLLIGLYFSIYMLMTGGLTVYHSQLVRRNLTTNEHQNAFRYKYLKDENGAFRNPYDRGCLQNFISRFFPGKDAKMLVISNKKNGNVSSLFSSNSSHDGMDIDMRNSSDKKHEEKLSLVQNVV
jgi:palmitoyltransferase